MIDTNRWKKIIQKPDWYITLYSELQAYQKQWEEHPDSEETKLSKDEVRSFFELALESGDITLGLTGQNLDVQREPIDTVVIHHTSSEPGYTLPHMNAVQMLNVYIPYFNDPVGPGEVELKGQPLWSNHLRKGRPVFYLYHWLMRMDGSVVRLLNDEELGWHAANWEINRRSVGICLDNDYGKTDPTPKLLRQLAEFIVKEYPQVEPERIWGHKEVSQKATTTCPGRMFVGGWKEDLLQLVGHAKNG